MTSKILNLLNLNGSQFLFAKYFASFSGKKLINLFELEGILRKNEDFFVNFYTDFSDPVKPVYSWNRSAPESRNAFLAGAAVLTLGIVIQGYTHAVDPWLVIALIVMIVVKIGTRIWSDKNL